jgi:hypothetical protein
MKELKIKLSGKLKKGQPHQSVFDESSTEYPSNVVVEIIKYHPALSAKKKYNYLNWIILALIFSNTLLVFFTTGISPVLLWSLVTIIIVLNRRYKYYIWVVGLSFFYILSYFVFMLFDEIFSLSIIGVTVIVLHLIIIVLISFVSKKILPKVIVTKERLRINGAIKIVRKFKFN